LRFARSFEPRRTRFAAVDPAEDASHIRPFELAVDVTPLMFACAMPPMWTPLTALALTTTPGVPRPEPGVMVSDELSVASIPAPPAELAFMPVIVTSVL